MIAAPTSIEVSDFATENEVHLLVARVTERVVLVGDLAVVDHEQAGDVVVLDVVRDGVALAGDFERNLRQVLERDGQRIGRMGLGIAAADLARQEDAIHVRIAGLLLGRRPEQHAVRRTERQRRVGVRQQRQAASCEHRAEIDA